MRRSILITGASGFLGRNVIRTFKNYYIYAVTRNPGSHSDLKCKSVEVMSWDEFESRNIQVDFVLNLAGKAHDLKKVSSDIEYFEANVEYTKKIFNWFVKSGSSTFIQISSIKAIVDHSSIPVNENLIENPFTIYGRTKLIADQHLMEQVELVEKKGKRIYILRPCMIHGPGNKGNLNLLFHFVNKGIPYPFGSFDNKRSFTSVDNLIFLIERLLNQNALASRIYVVSDNSAISTKKLVNLIASCINKKARVWNISQSFIRATARVGDVLHLPINTERLTKLTESFEVDASLIIKDLKVQLPVNLEDGIRKTINSFKNG